MSDVPVPKPVAAPVVELHGVSLVRAGVPVLDGIDLAVASGEVFMLLGASGSGKTSLLKLVNRLLEPTSGEVRVAGQAVTAWEVIQLRRRMGYVMQDAGLFPHLTVERNVGLLAGVVRLDAGAAAGAGGGTAGQRRSAGRDLCRPVSVRTVGR
jgi:osmoprotectant transport system ATP-binding protein